MSDLLQTEQDTLSFLHGHPRKLDPAFAIYRDSGDVVIRDFTICFPSTAPPLLGRIERFNAKGILVYPDEATQAPPEVLNVYRRRNLLQKSFK